MGDSQKILIKKRLETQTFDRKTNESTGDFIKVMNRFNSRQIYFMYKNLFYNICDLVADGVGAL